MRKLVLVLLLGLSSLTNAQGFNFGYDHLHFRNLIQNGICYIKTGDSLFDQTVLNELEEHWKISTFTFVERYKKPEKESTAFFVTQKERTKKYMMDRANQNLLVLQKAKDYHKDKDVPVEETLGYMYFNGFYPLMEVEEQHLFVGYVIQCIHSGLELIKKAQFSDSDVALENKVMENINAENKSYNGNTLILNREQTRAYIDEKQIEKLGFKYRLLGKEEYYKALKTEDKSHYMIYYSVNTKTELSLISVVEGRWIYTKHFPEGYVSLDKNELKLLKAYF